MGYEGVTSMTDQIADARPPTRAESFMYLLNAFEQASQADHPADHGYGDKRRALVAYVRQLDSDAAQAVALRARVQHLTEALETGPLFSAAIQKAVAHIDMPELTRALVLDNSAAAVRYAVLDVARAALTPPASTEGSNG
jgi:hypothetical protein